jgi:hypothetical protein
MAKADDTNMTSLAGFQTLLARYKTLESIGAEMSAANDEGASFEAICDEMTGLEGPILIAKVGCLADIDAKWQFATDYVLPDARSPELNRLIRAIFERDVLEVGATTEELAAEGITVT